MRRGGKLLMVLMMSLLTGGCAVLNPYESEFKCPPTYAGRCISVQDAYTEDRKQELDALRTQIAIQAQAGGGGEVQGAAEALPEAKSYRAALYDRMASMLQEPQTPVVLPPKAMRVLFATYRGLDNELIFQHYNYFFVQEPQWVLGETRAVEGE